MTYLVITKNTETIRSVMNEYKGTELIGSQLDFIVWKWTAPHGDDLTSVQDHADYLGTVELR